MKSTKPYQIQTSYKSDRQRRARKPLHNSPLPAVITRTQTYKNFVRMSPKRRLLLIGWSGGSALVAIALFTTVYFANTLGSTERIMNRNKTGVTLQDQSGQTIARLFNARDVKYVPLTSIAPVAQKAAISSEDKNFYKEPGFSVRGIGFALWQNVKPGGTKGGGSTLTQQLVAS